MSSAGERQPASGRASLRYGLMSLWDMINCHISGLCLCSQLMLYEIVLGDCPEYTDGPHDAAGDGLVANLRGWLKIAATIASDFELDSVNDRVSVIEKRLAKQRLTNSDISTEMRVLRETVEAGLRNQLVYRYPKEKAKIFFRWKADWSLALKSFPSAERDIQAGIDLWALGHGAASVFQFMRVLECGLRALAQDVGKTFDVQQWQNIIDEIESAIKAEGKSLPRGMEKNERLQFLSEAAEEFVYFKDGWRNYVSHGRGVYDEYQTRSIMEHVRAFMIVLSAKLNEGA